MTDFIKSLLIKIGICAVLIIGAFGYGYYRGHTSGEAKGEADAKTAQDNLKACKTQNEGLSKDLSDVNKQAQANQAQADAQRKRADDMVAQLAKEQKDRQASEKAWQKKLDAATLKPECSALKENLCPAVMDY